MIVFHIVLKIVDKILSKEERDMYAELCPELVEV
jgi:hypothetical protein